MPQIWSVFKKMLLQYIWWPKSFTHLYIQLKQTCLSLDKLIYTKQAISKLLQVSVSKRG